MGGKGFGDSVVSRTWCLGGGTLASSIPRSEHAVGKEWDENFSVDVNGFLAIPNVK